MPFDPSTLTHDRPWRFVDRREAGDDITREDLDIALNDLADGITASTAASVVYVGSWNPASLAFPALRPDGTAVQARDAFVASGSGTVGGVSFVAGDTLVALVSRPGQSYASRWLKVPTVTVPAMLDIREAAENFAAAAQGDTVALVASTAAGILAVADGETFAVAADSTLSLYRRDGSSATLLMADYRPNAPLVPHVAPAAPAIITAMEALKSEGVPLKMVMGRNYSVDQNGAAIFNSVSEDIFGAGLKIYDPDGVEVRCTSQIYWRDDMNIDGCGRARFVKAYDATGISNAFFRHVDYNVDMHRIRLHRVTITTLSPSMRGTMGRLFAHGFEMTGCEVSEFYNGQGLFVDGTDIDIINNDLVTEATMWGTGALRLGYVQNVRVLFNRIKCHDDGLMVLPTLGVHLGNDARRSLGARDVLFFGNHVRNAAKFAIINLPQQAYATDPWPYRIENIQIISNVGEGCTRGVVIGNPSNAGDQSAVFDNIVVKNNILRMGSTDLSARNYVISKRTGGIGKVIFDNNHYLEAHSGTASRVLWKVNAADCDLTLREDNGGGRVAVLHSTRHGRIVVEDCKHTIYDQADLPSDDDPENPPDETDPDAGGSGDPDPIVLDHDGSGYYVAASASSSSVLALKGKNTVTGIRNNGSGVRVLAGTAIVPELVADQKSGATGTRAASGASGAKLEVGDRITGTVASLTDYDAATVTYLPRRTSYVPRKTYTAQMTAQEELGSRLVAYVTARDLDRVLKSTGGDPVSAIGDAVGQLTDHGSAARNLTQGNPSNRPLMASDAGLWSIQFDGSNDGMASANIDLTAQQEIWLWAAINKLSDASQGAVLCFGNAASISGAVELHAPGTGGAVLGVRAQGANTISVTTASATYAAPWRGVIGAHVNFATDTTELYVGASVVASSASDLGADYLANAAIRIGGRSSASLLYGGFFHGAQVSTGAMSAAEIASTVRRLGQLQE